MPQSLKLTLADEIYNDLRQWAGKEGRPVANLAGFIVETAIRQARERGIISDTPDSELLKAIDLLRKLTEDEQPTDAEIIYASHATGISQEKLIALCDRLLEKKTNGFS